MIYKHAIKRLAPAATEVWLMLETVAFLKTQKKTPQTKLSKLLITVYIFFII